MVIKTPIKAPLALLHPAELSAWIGSRLRDRRLALNLTRKELATRAGVSPETIKLIEDRGRSSLGSLSRLFISLRIHHGLEALFDMPAAQTLDDLEKHAAAKTRRRARKKRVE